jgi:hypothetical protein
MLLATTIEQAEERGMEVYCGICGRRIVPSRILAEHSRCGIDVDPNRMLWLSSLRAIHKGVVFVTQEEPV